MSLPLHIDYLTLTEALKQQMYRAPGGQAELWRGSDSCQYLYVMNPRFVYNEGRLSLETDGKLSIGIALSGNCVSPLNWAGIIEADLEPFISPDLTIKLRVTDLNLYESSHKKSLLVGRGFDLIKGNLIPRLETFGFDLKPAVQQLENLALAAATSDNAERLKTAFSTLHPISAVMPEAESLKVIFELTISEISTPLASASAGPPTAAEINAWEGLLDNWDAFTVFAIKQLGASVADQTVRAELFNLLLDTRYRLVQALEQPQSANGPDPIRILFLDDWTRLGKIVHSTAQRGLLGDRALQFLSFISAGDALFALDQAAPALGMRISVDDLRRLARIMAPQYAADPLAFSFDEDPELQKMFGVYAPLESPGLSEPPAPSPAATNAAPTEEPSSPAATPSWFPSPISRFPNSLRFGAAEADAAEDQSVDELLRVGAALNHVVVDEANTNEYTHAMRSLLTLTAQHEFEAESLAPHLHKTYLNLVESTGLQESCWRQFIRRRDRITFLESSTGDIGLMQVNKHVWRGFYRLWRLEWDITYNASAGAEILLRLMRTKAIKVGPSADQLTALARSTYSAYNGGPDAYDRWRNPKEPERLRAIDSAFWGKYQAIVSNQPLDIVQCAIKWDSTRGH